jgi:hypothetical protein
MKRTSFSIALVLAILLGAIVPTIADGQPPGYGVNATGTTIGFIEKFALADDRTIAMQELIPGSHDYFYYHILHHQNSGQLPEAQGMLEQWSALQNLPPTYQKLLTRQRILSYASNPQGALDYLRQEMGLTLGHAPPQADQAKDLPTFLDPSIHDPKRLLDAALVHDPSLSTVSEVGLLQLLSRDLPIDKLRIVLQKLQRIDVPNLSALVGKELRAADSPGWGAYPIHSQLTLEQRQQLARDIPQLLENDVFVRQYLLRLLPNDDVAPHNLRERRAHLQRLEDFTSTLPPSQNSLKGLVLYQRLMLDLTEEKFDRPRFERYLALPRNQFYCNPEFVRANRNVPMIDFGAQYDTETRLPPIMNDAELIRRYLEHFLQSDDKIDRFAKWLDRGFLDRVLIETKILYGLGNAAEWYKKLNAADQKTLRDRIELKFAPISKTLYQPDEPVQLVLDVKNVPKLIIRLYQLNPRNIYRRQGKQVSSDIDLDGLVANAEQTIEYTVPGDRRHREVIELPQCSGRGAWVIDLLGGGLRSRAMILKGQLRSTQSLTDAGHEFRIYDESGKPVPSATIEMGTRTFRPDEQGRILIPYSESNQEVSILLVDEAVATVERFIHRREEYRLELGLLVDPQNLISGAKGALIARPQLLCNGQPTAIKNLEDPILTIVTTDQDGTKSTLAIPNLSLKDEEDLFQQFLVPQRLRDVQITLSGKVLAVSRNIKEVISESKNLPVNDVSATAQLADFYLIHDADGYRLQVLGRNGERVAKLPVTVQLQTESVANDLSVLLATDAEGQIRLGSLDHVKSFQASATGLANRMFSLRKSISQWPAKHSVVAGTPIDFPWSDDLDGDVALGTASTLLEVRGGHVYADLSTKLSLDNGRLKIPSLEPGLYYLTHHRAGLDAKVTEIRAVRGAEHHGFILGESQSVESSPPTAVSIAKTDTLDGKLRLQISGAREGTRVHVLATPYVSDTTRFRLLLSGPPHFRQTYTSNLSFYADSLRLDEEYQYILQRQYATKYPGNLLPQPSLLLNPWDTASTENARREAGSGDATPPSPANPQAADAFGLNDASAAPKAAENQGRSSYEFLSKPAAIVANRRPDANGWIEVPLAELQGYHGVTAVIVSDEGVSSKTIPLPASEIPTADLRLAQAFQADQHLAQVQRAKILEAGIHTDLGDARSTRIQIYSSLSDVYRLYSTLSPSPELEKFRVLTRWNQLKDEEKSHAYSELACHELHLFLYHKDRDFFDRVVSPYIDDKYQKQLTDRYLLTQDLSGYLESWQRHRLNTLERIMLADRIANVRGGTRKWIADAVTASPISSEERSQRFLAALAGSSLDLNRAELATLMFSVTPRFGIPEERLSEELSRDRAAAGYAEFGKRADKNAVDFDGAEEEKRNLGGLAGGGMGGSSGKPESAGASRGLARKESRRGSLGRQMMYTSLDATREWAENQFYRTRIQQQNLPIIPPGPLWLELSNRDSIERFLSTEFHLTNHTLSEMLAVMAILDLPFDSLEVVVGVENDRLMVKSPSQSVVFLESIEPIQAGETSATILVGQDIYVANLGANADAQQPVTGQSLVRGVGYRTNVVVTNPGNSPQTVSVLTQIPQGAVPLEGGKRVSSKTLRLEPYTTQQLAYTFYFPTAGEFQHYGAQVSIAGQFAAEAPSAAMHVLDAPEDQNKESWSYIALWGTNEQVLDYLRTRNVQQVQLDLIAFRMQDKGFYDACLKELESQGIYQPVLWAYSVQHNDPPRIQQLIAFRPEWADKLGPVFRSAIATIDTANRYTYEHLDYRPLVNARTHLLGAERVILNQRLAGQYQQLLERLAYQPAIRDEERMAIAYYLLVQSRMDEAKQHFERIAVDALPMRIQYDYMDAYLDFYRDRYDRAAEIADRYANYGVSRWRDLFGQIRLQVAQRRAMMDGRPVPVSDPNATDVTDPVQRMLLDARGMEQDTLASDTPALDLKIQDGRLLMTYQNIDRVDVRYYQMDIELLFSRNPFVQQEGGSLMSIQPNRMETLPLAEKKGKQEIAIPKDFTARNVLVEVSSGALSQSQVLVSNAMDITLADAFGRLQATSGNDKPVERAYTKVYARHKDGTIRFYKDGYTDLRGQFDYASLSTNDLDSVDRFAILILHPELGAWIREVSPPKR